MTSVERRFPARPERLGDIRRLVADIAVQSGCGDELVGDIVLAVDEACQNIIRHAYRGKDGDIVVQVDATDDALIVRLIDFAPPVDVSRIRPRPLDEIRPGGLGTHLIREVMDEIAFLPPPKGAGNLLQMIKHIGDRQ